MVILVTGGNRGLGLFLVKESLGRGHKVIAACRTLSPELEKLRGEYGESLYIQDMDAGDGGSVEMAAFRVSSGFAHIDVIINNAAILLESKYYGGDPVINLPLKVYEDTLSVNTMGPIRVLHYFAPLLYKSTNPVIINITSEGAALKPAGSHYIAYAVSKYALNMYTQKIRNYYHERKNGAPVKIFMVHPGRMNTVMGTENAQIEPELPAAGILNIIEGKTVVDEPDIPFIDFRGNAMPDHYIPSQ